MAKYCPKCYTGVGPDDAVCGNCGNVLKENTRGVEDFTAGVFDNENLSHDISGKEIPGETPDEEVLSHEIVTDEIIADGIVEEEVIVSETLTTTSEPAQTQTQYQSSTQRQTFVDNTEVPMTLGDWMLTLLLLYLPIVNLVMLIIWSVDSKPVPPRTLCLGNIDLYGNWHRPFHHFLKYCDGHVASMMGSMYNY